MRRFLVGGGATLGVLAAVLLAAVELRWERTHDAPYPELRATTDSAAIARGRYLAYGPAHCASCHAAPADRPRLATGEAVPMRGGAPFRIPVGTWHVPNITTDPATGIGRVTDAELARVLRHGVRRDGRTLLPAMEYGGLADEDVVALLSFLRSQRPAPNAVPEHDVNLLGRAIMAFGMEPRLAVAPPRRVPDADMVARGRYLADEVASCDACHTQRNLATGAYSGPAYGGGTVFADEGDTGFEFVAPNLTAHPRAGRTGQWTEAQFVARLRAGRSHPDSPMHWESFSLMTEEDLRAVYRYLRSLPPSAHDPGPPRRPAA